MIPSTSIREVFQRDAAFARAMVVELASRYRKFPMVNTPGVFVNNLAHEMPVFLLARFFDADVVGFYMLTDRLLNQPTALIGQWIVNRLTLPLGVQSQHVPMPQQSNVIHLLSQAIQHTDGRCGIVAVSC